MVERSWKTQAAAFTRKAARCSGGWDAALTISRGQRRARGTGQLGVRPALLEQCHLKWGGLQRVPGDAFVITAYLTDNVKKGRVLWPTGA
jgi:hypothetical protein